MTSLRMEDWAIMKGLFRLRFGTYILIAMLFASMTLVACAAGADGANGANGAPGKDGADGKDGTTDVGGISVVGGQVEALETVDADGNSTWSAAVTVIGGGFDSGSVEISSSASGVSGSASANSDGAFSETFTMTVTPDDLGVPITVTASAGSKLASTGFVVVNNEDNWVRAE